MTYTLGELVDKLAVIHLKIWHLEEEVEKLSKNKEDNIPELERICDQIVNLNSTRNKIIKSIDEFKQ